jgi:hypothetical protein
VSPVRLDSTSTAGFARTMAAGHRRSSASSSLGASEIAVALHIGRSSVYRVLEATR